MAGIFLVAIIILAATLYRLMPLKTVVPVALEVAPDTRTAVTYSDLKRFRPAHNDIAFAAAKWAEQVLTIQRHLVEVNLRAAQDRTCGAAEDQLLRFVKEENPINRLYNDPNMTRVVSFPTDPTFPPQADNTVHLRVRTVTDTVVDGTHQSREEFWVIVLNYALREIGEQISFDDFRRNPLGICWTSFHLQKESTR